MAHPIRITVGDRSLAAELNDSTTARAILAALPIESAGSRWGDEIYFGIPVAADPEAGARADMAVGELAYWPPGQAFCIFFGPTPASTDDRPRAASDVNPIGRVLDPVQSLSGIPDGAVVRIEAR